MIFLKYFVEILFSSIKAISPSPKVINSLAMNFIGKESEAIIISSHFRFYSIIKLYEIKVFSKSTEDC